jgi:predicted amidohydrolase
MTPEKRLHTTRIACCQIALVPDEASNLSTCLNWIDQASQVNPDLIVLPEMSNWSAGLVKSRADALEHSVAMDGAFMRAIADKAQAHRCYIALGVIERLGEETFITSVIISPAKETVLKYQKQIPFGPQIAWATPGRTGNPVVALPFAKVGVYICADGLIPETTRVLALKGAQLLINTLHSGGSDETHLHVPVRAYENRVWLVSANKVGKRDLGALDRFSGGSQIVSPQGDILARADALTDSFVWADIDFNDPQQAQSQKSEVLELRRPECYGTLVAKPLYPFEKGLFKGPATLGVSALQPKGHGLDALHEAIEQWGQAVFQHGSRLVVLPYLLMHDLEAHDFDPSLGALKDAQALALVQQTAQSSSSWVVFSSIKAHGADPSKFDLCTDLIDPSGVVVGSHTQLHLTRALKAWASAGSEFQVFQTPIGRIGLLCGADAQVLESFRVLSYLGAQLICVSGAVGDAREIDLGLRERVAENRVHVVLASRSDAPCSNGSVVVKASAYPSEPHWRVRFPDVLRLEPGFTHVSASLDMLATCDKTVAPLGCDLFLSPRQEEYTCLIDSS